MAIATEEQVLINSSSADPEQIYRERCQVFGQQRDQFEAQSRLVSNIRLGVFGLIALCAIFLISGGGSLYIVAGLALAVVFVALVVYHDRIITQARRYAQLYEINDLAQKRRLRRWKELPARPFTAPPADHAYANDLDVFGTASLFQLLDVTSTTIGSATLQNWLLQPANANELRDRQTAVAELAPEIDLRDEITLRGRLIGEKKPDPTPFLRWAKERPWLMQRPLFVWIGRILAVAIWASIIVSATGIVPYPIWIAFLALNLVFLGVISGPMETTLGTTYESARAFRFYTQLFEIASTAKLESPKLRQIQARLTTDGLEAHKQMNRLARIAGLAIPPSMLYLPIQLLSFWNLNVLYFLERWQQEAGPHAESWLDALGEFEALVSLAGLAHANPAWVFPTTETAGSPKSAARVQGQTLGHPLIAPDVMVANDVEVGPAGTFLLVTGSNMSGKSTLLRSLGTNIVLAQAGSVVCAQKLSLPPLELYTSIRIQDSLEQGISLFMAELLRLKQVVQAADRIEREGQRTLFYLLDEILHGTNTAERQIAARRILVHLLDTGAIGAISSHDLQLADTPELEQARRDVHFVEAFRQGPEGPSMTFDYQLRPGLATSTNALRLMQIVGLDLDDK